MQTIWHFATHSKNSAQNNFIYVVEKKLKAGYGFMVVELCICMCVYVSML